MRAFAFVLPVLVLLGCGPQLIGRPEQRFYVANKDCHVERPDAASRWAQDVMCNRAHFTPEIVAATPLDLDVDPVTAAGFVALCGASPRCDPAQGGSDWYADPDAEPVADDAPAAVPAQSSALAFGWDLATRLDAEAVTAALARGSLPGYMQADFVARFRAAAGVLDDRVAALGRAWRELFLRPMTTARAARAADDDALAPWQPLIEELEVAADQALVTGAPDADTLDAALAMRRNYVAECRLLRDGFEPCLGDALGQRLTALIHRLAKGLGDEALLQAEAEVGRVADVSDPRTAVWTAIHEALEAERARYAEYRAAVDQGISQAALDLQWPEPPLVIPPMEAFLGVPPGDHGGWYPGKGTQEVVEAVRAIKRSGTRATIKFRKDIDKGYESTGCYETSKVEGFDDYGRVIYRTKCTGERAYTDDRTLAPVTVPWVEVAHVEAGEVIHVVVDTKTRKGHVAWVGAPRPKGDVYTRDTARVQLREWRLKK